jgi:hypothetical protein
MDEWWKSWDGYQQDGIVEEEQELQA